MQEFYPDLIHALSLVVVGAFLLLAKTFRDRALANYEGEEDQRHEASLNAAVARAVDYFEQTSVGRIKAAAADGKLTVEELEAELRHVKEDAFDTAKSALTQETIAHFDESSAKINTDGIIDMAIEAYLAQKKGTR